MTLALAYERCPICGSDQFQKERDADCTSHPMWHPPLPGIIEWMRCSNCRHGFTRTYWTEAGLTEVFATSHDNQVVGSGENPHNRRAEWADTVTTAVDLLGGYSAAMSPEQPVWIDVGCGSGYLAMLANETGFAELGLDTRPEPVQSLKGLAYNAVQADFNQAGFTRPATVVSMMDVLEHMPFPVPALNKAKDTLRPGGLLIISLPSEAAVSWRLMDRVVGPFIYWSEIEHHHNFTPDRLRRVLEAVGFRVERVRYPQRYLAQVEIYARKV